MGKCAPKVTPRQEINHPVPFDKEKRQNSHEKHFAAMIRFERFNFSITLQRCKYRKLGMVIQY